MTFLEDTDASADRRRAASQRGATPGARRWAWCMTLVVVADEEHVDDALDAARSAAREHPSRLLGVIIGSARGHVHDRRRHPGGRRLRRRARGDPARGRGREAPRVRRAARCCCRTPPSSSGGRDDAPADPAEDPVGRLAEPPDHRRRSGLAAAARRPCSRSAGRTRPATPTWPGPGSPRGGPCWPPRSTRCRARSSGVEVAAERVSPSADLLAAWLADRLKVPGTTAHQRRTGHHRGGADRRSPATSGSAGLTGGWPRLLGARPARPTRRAAAARHPGPAHRGAPTARPGRRLRRHHPTADPDGQGRRQEASHSAAEGLTMRGRRPDVEADRGPDHDPLRVAQARRSRPRRRRRGRRARRRCSGRCSGRARPRHRAHRGVDRPQGARGGRRTRGPPRDRLGSGSRSGGATSGSSRPTTWSATAPRRGRTCWASFPSTRPGCTRCADADEAADVETAAEQYADDLEAALRGAQAGGAVVRRPHARHRARRALRLAVPGPARGRPGTASRCRCASHRSRRPSGSR